MLFKPALLVVLICLCMSAGARPARSAPRTVPAEPVLTLPAPVLRSIALTNLGAPPMIRLRTIDDVATINFGLRRDELVTKLALRLHYTYSPALIPEQSHIRLLLNGEPVGVLPVVKDGGGRKVESRIELDPRLLTDFNRLSLQFIGHYTQSCEDPLHNSLWADVSGASELEMTVQALRQSDDLALLPEPFFDPRDVRRLSLPFVFARAPTHGTLRAAAITSSWFGKLAAWRGARFPSFLDRLPTGHAVVFAMNGERPTFMREMATVAAPTLSVIDNPADPRFKLLLVQGRDAHDLRVVATAMALGSAAVSGSRVEFDAGREPIPRLAYDAPNWVRLDRPTKFGELTGSRNQLQAFGHQPDPLSVSMRISPDLFTWRSRGVPIDLKYRYTPPIRVSESRLTVSINGELVQGFNLRASGEGGDSNRVRLPLLDDGLLGEARDFRVPAFKLGVRNDLQFTYSFTYHKEGNCKDTQVENVRAMIDADSTIDFSGYPHYAQMPHLGAFATAGFPFTKYADLSQTALVMPEQAGEHDIAAMLYLMGRMGESTGYPATLVRVVGPKDQSRLKGLDLLLIGSAPAQSLLTQWNSALPANITGTERKISQPKRSVSFLYDWLGFNTTPDPDVVSTEKIRGNGPLAALLGFESPLSDERSVVALTATTPDQMALALDALDNPALVKDMHGSAVFFRGKTVESILAGKTYTVGSIPFWTVIWYPLSSHPVLLAFLAVLAIIVFGFALWRTLKSIAARRIEQEQE